MATRAQLEAFDARDAAAREAYPRAIAETDRKVTEGLEEARIGLVAGIMALAEACGVTPDRCEELEAELGTKAAFVVSGIFNAAVLEVRKEEDAKSASRAAGETAKVRKEHEQLEQAHANPKSAIEDAPIFTERHPNPLKKRMLDAGRKN